MSQSSTATKPIMLFAQSLLIFLLPCISAHYINQRLLRAESYSCELPNGQGGQCLPFEECPSAIEDFQQGQWPVICHDNSEDLENPFVCCDQPKDEPPNDLPNKPRPGEISRRKCEEYSKWIVEPIFTPGEIKYIVGDCGAQVATFILGGTEAKKLEFPHMVRLGFYDKSSGEISYACGGSLISPNFVITAAHCLQTKQGAKLNVSHVKIGFGDSRSVREIKVAEKFRHNEHSDEQKYNDIALLRLETNVKFNDYRRPACLQVDDDIPKTNVTASGFGRTEKKIESEKLLKVNLPLMDVDKCNDIYFRTPQLRKGLDAKTMICAGATDSGKDTCKGDSGGPLQYVRKEPYCMYSIIGVTSFGMTCGTEPGVYTRVSAYIDWIESIVWPQDPTIS